VARWAAADVRVEFALGTIAFVHLAPPRTQPDTTLGRVRHVAALVEVNIRPQGCGGSDAFACGGDGATTD
jgi:hypothetical protein